MSLYGSDICGQRVLGVRGGGGQAPAPLLLPHGGAAGPHRLPPPSPPRPRTRLPSTSSRSVTLSGTGTVGTVTCCRS